MKLQNMIKSSLFLLMLFCSQLFASKIVLPLYEQQLFKNIGVNIIEIASVNEGFIENNSLKSKVALAKVTLDQNFSKAKVYDPFIYDKTDKPKIVNKTKKRSAILIITGDHVHALVDRDSYNNDDTSGTIGSVYPFDIGFFPAKKLTEFVPKSVKIKYGIIVPTQAAIDMYLFWNGKRFELVMTDDVP